MIGFLPNCNVISVSPVKIKMMYSSHNYHVFWKRAIGNVNVGVDTAVTLESKVMFYCFTHFLHISIKQLNNLLLKQLLFYNYKL